MTDLIFTETEREFYTSFARILTHLADRAIKAEREVVNCRHELEVLRERVEFDAIMKMNEMSLGDAAQQCVGIGRENCAGQDPSGLSGVAHTMPGTQGAPGASHD